MDAVLSEAAVRGSHRVGPSLINEVARELGWKQLVSSQPTTRPAPARRPVAAGPKPLEQEATGPKPAPTAKPVSEATAMMLLDPKPDTGEDTIAKPARDFPKPAEQLGENPGAMPMMDAEDTSATGMLRLEDLDAHFAETVFGEDATKSRHGRSRCHAAGTAGVRGQLSALTNGQRTTTIVFPDRGAQGRAPRAYRDVFTACLEKQSPWFGGLGSLTSCPPRPLSYRH